MKRMIGIVMSVAVAGCASDVVGTDNHSVTVVDSISKQSVAPALPLSRAASMRNQVTRTATSNGRYDVTTTIALPPSALLPQPAYDALQILEGLRTEPARTLFDLAAGAGLPAVNDVLDALPSSLEDKLYGWIDGYISSALFGGTTAGAELDSLLGAASSALTHFDLMTELTVPSSAGPGQHDVKSLRFDIAGTPTVIAVPASIAGTAGVSRQPTMSVSGRELTIGDHFFGLPVGDMLYSALDRASAARYGSGTTFRGALSHIISCEALAADVADKCIWGVCVGHESELRAICEKGLDEVDSQVKAKLAAYDFQAIRFATGTAALVDQPRDGVIDSMAGTWQCEIDLTLGARAVDATFTGTRIQ